MPASALNLLLFLLTVASTLAAGAATAADAVLATAEPTLSELARAGAPYSLSLLAVLGTHEMGHYLLARLHRVDASLPYFIPMPFGPWGTFGAFIRLRSRLPSRRALLDIGAAGPVAGFVVAVPLLFVGLAVADLVPEPQLAGGALQSPFSLALAWWKGQPLLPQAGATMLGDSALTWAAERIVHGTLPRGMAVQGNPILFAAWIGLFVTTLNLIPVGQLDGGHVLYALFGQRRAERLSVLASWLLLAMGIFASFTWLVWWVLIRFVLGTGHPPPAQDEPLTPARRRLGWACVAIFLLTFVPAPITT